MGINEIIVQKGLTKYRLSVMSGVPHATLNDLCNGRTRIEKCSGETLYKLAKALQVSMEALIEGAMGEWQIELDVQESRERSYEYGLPAYLQHDLDEFKNALEHGSTLIDCFWNELYSSINIAEITDGIISSEHADYLRQKFLWR